MRQTQPGQLQRALNNATGLLLYFVIVFSPWAFGTTEFWAMRLMNCVGWILGAIAILRWVNGGKGNRALRWGMERAGTGDRLLVTAIGAISVVVLSWIGVSAWNASAVYSPATLQFTYREFVTWLPHSYDAPRSWAAFENYSALACFFWVLHRWLLEKTEVEASNAPQARRLPRRLKTLLWVLSVNGAALACEGLVQRLSGSTRLLWLVQPTVNPGAESQFGPYAYRSNAAQYFNLLWPVALGFWFTLFAWERRPSKNRPTHHLLLSCVMLMAACPLVSDSRAGAAVTIGLLLASGLIFVAAYRGESCKHRGALTGFTMLTLLLGLAVGGESLQKRLVSLDVDHQGRQEIYSTAQKMADDYPWLGTGPGTFDSLFQMYRQSPTQYWPAQLHNDWLETRITFGRIGMALILAALALCFARWFVPGAIGVPWTLPAFIWLAQFGCLLHARVDFPFQVYSIVLLFVVECSVLLSISRKA